MCVLQPAAVMHCQRMPRECEKVNMLDKVTDVTPFQLVKARYPA